jgi:hypothetical protein
MQDLAFVSILIHPHKQKPATAVTDPPCTGGFGNRRFTGVAVEIFYYFAVHLHNLYGITVGYVFKVLWFFELARYDTRFA